LFIRSRITSAEVGADEIAGLGAVSAVAAGIVWANDAAAVRERKIKIKYAELLPARRIASPPVTLFLQ